MFDTDMDDRITSLDDVWPRLLLWRDENHNGFSEEDELAAVSSSGIQALELKYHTAAREDRHGNGFRYGALLHVRGRVEPYYDVVLRQVD